VLGLVAEYVNAVLQENHSLIAIIL
jgi:hypothetical protein